jgi:hypothetical protein
MVEANRGMRDQDLAIAACFIAFGRGAGNIEVSPDAVRELVRVYRPLIEHHAEDWETQSRQVLDYAEALGRLAAHIAVGEGELAIGKGAVIKATRMTKIPCLRKRGSTKRNR